MSSSDSNYKHNLPVGNFILVFHDGYEFLFLLCIQETPDLHRLKEDRSGRERREYAVL